MSNLLQQLREALRFEAELAGPAVPLGAKTALPPDDEVSAGADAVPTSEHTPSVTDDMSSSDLFGKKPDPTSDPSLPPRERIEALIPATSPLKEFDSLEALREWVADTVLIPLDRTRLNPVFGVGNPEADLMVIGEAPGADEDRLGEPFVGKAGQLLNKILEAINFKREDVYIANILKSRPPNNRDPEPDEIAAHIPILYKQISLIDPKIILCVGRTSANGLLGRNATLGALRNKIHDYHGIPLIVTYHPAALLRNPQWKYDTWEDVKMLRTRYDQLVAR